METVIRIAGVSGLGFAISVIVVCGALAILFLSYYPNRQYVDVARGVFPKGGQHKVGRFRGGRPPMRTKRPDMTVAEGALISRDAYIDELTLASIVDLATRGYLTLVEYKELALSRNSAAIVFKRKMEPDGAEIDRAFLCLLSVPGASESPDFSSARPFDMSVYRLQLQKEGLIVSGTPTARISGLRKSLSQRLGASVALRAQNINGWYIRWKATVASIGAFLFLLGVFSSFIAVVAWLFADRAPYWVLASLIVAVCGGLSLGGPDGRTARGSVAYDQALGFRRFLVEASSDADVAELTNAAGWAIALDCVDEWIETLVRINAPVEVPWLVSTRRSLDSWEDVRDFILVSRQRIHAEATANDSNSPLPPLSDDWGSVPSSW